MAVEYVNLRGETVTDLGCDVVFEIIYCHDNARIFCQEGRPADLRARGEELKEQARDAWKRFRAICPAEEQPRRIGDVYHREAAIWGF